MAKSKYRWAEIESELILGELQPFATTNSDHICTWLRLDLLNKLMRLQVKGKPIEQHTWCTPGLLWAWYRKK